MDPSNTRRTAVLFALAAALWVVAPASGQRGRAITLVAGREAVSHEILVKFRNSRANAAAEVKQQVDVDDDRPVGNHGARRLRSRTFDVDALVHYLQSHPDVEYAEPNYIVHSTAVPNDTQFGNLWGLRNLGQVVNGTSGVPGADIDAVSAWDISTGSTANVVGIVDTGINYSHPDLSANMWTAPMPFTVTVGGSNVTCAAGTFGFNAINRTCNPMDDNHHGSHTAGTVGARGNNATGVAGVNWTARLMGLKFLDSTGSGATSDAVDAIEFAIQTKARFGSAANVRILSNSWGGPDFSQTLLDEVTWANTNEMLFVVAAGNSASNNDVTPFYPARFNAPNVIAVAATNSSDQLAGFSNWGQTSVHLGAPGVNILSTSLGNTYEYLNGTSMATPHVAGAAALVLSRCALSTADLKTNLLSTVDLLGSLTNLTITGGRLNVNTAIRSCLPSAPSAFNKSVPANGTSGQPLATTLSWTASSGATSYEYCVDTTNNSSCDGSWTSTGTAQSAALSGLSTSTTYYWQVRARNASATTDADFGTWWRFTTQPTTQSWFDPNWAFRRPVVVGNTTGGALTNYQVQVTLDGTTFDFSRAQTDGRDLRVTDATGTVTVPFWIDTWNAAAQRATIWAKLPTLPTAGATIYLYYGNAAASSTTASGTATFDLYDGFEGLAVGSPPGGSGTLTWTYGGSVTAASSPVHLGTRSLQQQNSTQLTSSFTALTQGVIGAWVRRTTATAGDDDIYLYTNGALAATIGLGSSGRLHYWNGGFQDTAVAWTPGTWYLITATFDTTLRRFDFAVFDANGVLVVRVPNLAFASGSGGLSSALFYTSSAFTGTAYLDDVRLLRWTGAEATTTVGPQESLGGGPVPGAFGKTAPANAATGQPVALTLSWGASTAATSYEYCVDTTNNATCDGSWTTTGTAQSAALSGLVAGTTYYWQVRGVNGNGTTTADGGAWWSFTTQGIAPGALAKALPANAASVSTAPTLSWAASSGATSYEYCVDTTNNSSCDGSWTSTGTAQSAALSSLSTSTTYYWQVRARNASATTEADAGTWWSFTTQATQPWFDPNWAFRRPVVVGNTTGGALTNYQVQVTLDGTTFDFSRAQTDGRDLRVTDASGTAALPFWIDTWNAAAQRATIWVKLPTLPTAGATIYLYYGNAAAGSTTASGTATFDLYDGFEGLAVGSPPGGSGTLTWTYGGSVTAASSPVHLGTRSLQQQNPTQLTSSFTALTQGVIGAWVRRTTATAGDDDIYLYTNGALAATIGLGSSGRLHYWNGGFQDTAVAWTPGTWYLITATFDTTLRRFDFAVFDANGVLVVRVPGLAFASGSGGLSSALFYTSSAFTGTAYLDDVRLLRWTGAEATTTVGPQESLGGGPVPGAFGKTAPANAATGQPVALTLSWGASSAATSYEYCVDTTNNATCDGSWTTTGTAQTAALSGLVAGTTYYWQVRGVNGNGTTTADGGAWWSFTTQGTTQSWFDPNWAFRRPVVVGNTTGGALTNYQVQVTLDGTTFDFSRAQTDGRDLRVTDASGTAALPFWIDTWNAAAQRATIWVKLPTLPTAGATIYLYYGNAAAGSTTASGLATFDLYDGFEGLAVGSPPGGSGTLTWTAGGALTAASTPVHLGTRSLQQQNPTQLTSSFTAFSQGVIGAWVQRSTAAAGDDDIYLYTNGALAATIGLGSSGRLHYWNGAFQDTAAAWTPGTWYLITATFDTTLRRFDFAVFDANGVLVVRVPGLAFASGSGGLSSALFYTSSAFTGTAYLDDVRLLRWTGTEATAAVGAEEVKGAALF